MTIRGGLHSDICTAEEVHGIDERGLNRRLVSRGGRCGSARTSFPMAKTLVLALLDRGKFFQFDRNRVKLAMGR